MSADPAQAPGARWEELFDELAELPAPDRARRLAEIEAEDPALAARLARLLKADGETTDFLAQPVAELLGTGEERAAEPCLPAGTRIGPWRLLGLLGRGGMGEVYLAERDEGTFIQRAALKLIKQGMDSRAIVRRFVHERQILSRLEHPGIARLLDGGSAADGRPFFVLELVEGVPIDEHCRSRGLGLEERLRLLQSVCAAVDSAHHRLVVHRDLKPANILVTADGTVKLLDFGISKLLSGEEDEETAHLTQLGARVLTPAYAAPEQILGEPVTTATDVYALGVLLFELITGALPHARENRSLSSLASGVSRETAERPSGVLKRADARLSRRVAGDLDLIVLTAMHRDPARRYASAAALADDLGRFLASRPIRARPDSRGYRLRKLVVRHRLPVAVAAVGLAALLAGLGMALWQAHVARLAAQRADHEARRTERVKSFVLSVFRQSDPSQSESATAVSARELVERGVQRIDMELAGDPSMQADVLTEVVHIEDDLGLLDPALGHARRALALREAVLPRRDVRIAESRVLLGEMQTRHGDFDVARQTLEKALAETLADRGADSLETAQARRALAKALRRPADRARAVDLLRQALATIRQRLGDGNIEVAETISEPRRQAGGGGEAVRRGREDLPRGAGAARAGVGASPSESGDGPGRPRRSARPPVAAGRGPHALPGRHRHAAPGPGAAPRGPGEHSLLLRAAADGPAGAGGRRRGAARGPGHLRTGPSRQRLLPAVPGAPGDGPGALSGRRRAVHPFRGDLRAHARRGRRRALAGDRQPRLGSSEAEAGVAGAAGAHPGGGADRASRRPGEL